MANDDLSLTASRTFVASPQSVFSAWTDIISKNRIIQTVITWNCF